MRRQGSKPLRKHSSQARRRPRMHATRSARASTQRRLHLQASTRELPLSLICTLAHCQPDFRTDTAVTSQVTAAQTKLQQTISAGQQVVDTCGGGGAAGTSLSSIATVSMTATQITTASATGTAAATLAVSTVGCSYSSVESALTTSLLPTGS